MTDHLTVIFIGLVVFSTFTLEGISGFGSTVLALPFITLLLGLDRAVPLLSTLGLVLAFFIVSAISVWSDGVSCVLSLCVSCRELSLVC